VAVKDDDRDRDENLGKSINQDIECHGAEMCAVSFFCFFGVARKWGIKLCEAFVTALDGCEDVPVEAKDLAFIVTAAVLSRAGWSGMSNEQ
jgi:hypothetical protein